MMTDYENDRSSPQEPTVLDYVRAKLMPWRGPAPEIPELDLDSTGGAEAYWPVQAEEDQDAYPAWFSGALPWRTLAGLLLALVGQVVLMPPIRQGVVGLFFYLMAAGLLVWAWFSGELALAEPKAEEQVSDDFSVRWQPLLAGAILLVAAFFAFSQNTQTDEFLYNGLNLMLWFAGIALVLWAVWQPRPDLAGRWRRLAGFFRQDAWHPPITRHMVLVVLVFLAAVFFRVYRIGEVVPEMFSDHAEKLLDVYDLMQGHTKIFFERNTGREGLQFYLIAWAARLFDTGISFTSMKIGTVALGIIMLPYMYLLGKELGNCNVGLLAMALTGVSYWPNLLARVALRFIFYPALAAPTFYYLVRGLKTGKRHYFILSGIFLGIGLHGYTPFRAVPILVVIVMALYWLQQRDKLRFYRAFVWLGIVTFISLIVFLPLLRVWTQIPGQFNYRTATRLFGVDAGVEIPEGLGLVGVVLKNVWDGLLMFNWDSGDIWVNTIPGYPSLDLVAGAAFLIGVVLVLARFAAKGRWQDGFLLLGIPVLMLPSTLVLAFPQENPAPNRAGGAAVVVFLLAAIALEAVLRSVRTTLEGKSGVRLAAVLGVGLVLASAWHNYALTFSTFPEQYAPSAKNTSELGAVIEQFTDTVGSPDQVWVVAFPHWVDTRLVGINAGFPTKDFAIWPEELEATLSAPSPKLFLLNLNDQAGLEALQSLYPEGKYRIYPARYPEQNFLIYTVP